MGNTSHHPFMRPCPTSRKSPHHFAHFFLPPQEWESETPTEKERALVCVVFWCVRIHSVMCNKNSPSSPDIQTTSIMKRTRKPTKRYHSSSSSSSSSSSLKPHRRGNRTKTRRPKFVSLRLQLSEPKNMAAQPKPKALQQPQLNLFPLHPEHHDMHEEQNVALLFSSEGGATLTGLLEEDSMSPSSATTEGSLSALTCPTEDAGNWLVRKAMRRRESEEGSEERWVCYSEVVEEKKEAMEEVTSYCMMGTTTTTTSFGLLSLKLDHQGILNAWSDKGSLYVAGEGGPHTVPDFLNGFLLHNAFLPHVFFIPLSNNLWLNNFLLSIKNSHLLIFVFTFKNAHFSLFSSSF